MVFGSAYEITHPEAKLSIKKECLRRKENTESIEHIRNGNGRMAKIGDVDRNSLMSIFMYTREGCKVCVTRVSIKVLKRQTIAISSSRSTYRHLRT